jgi:hypothetical protein
MFIRSMQIIAIKIIIKGVMIKNESPNFSYYFNVVVLCLDYYSFLIKKFRCKIKGLSHEADFINTIMIASGKTAKGITRNVVLTAALRLLRYTRRILESKNSTVRKFIKKSAARKRAS